MDETIATKQHVRVWQLVAGEIELDELAPLPSVILSIGLDDRAHDVSADILDARQIDVVHPGKIPTRCVQQNSRAELSKRVWQFLAQHPSRVEARASPRTSLRVGPEIGVIDPLEPRLQSEPGQFLSLLRKSPLGD